MNTAEVLKRRIKAKYEQDAAAAKKQDNEVKKISDLFCHYRRFKIKIFLA
jgi:hypothetical protein